MSKEEIALQLTLKALDKVAFRDAENAKTLPYEIYNSILKNINEEIYEV